MGSPTGIWTSVSGAMAQSQNVDAIANNLANVNTTGFKKDAPIFKEYLASQERATAPVVDIPRTAFKDADFYRTDGRENTMVNVDRVVTDHQQGTFKNTSAPFDVAIDGPGFFALKTPSGLMFTRAGDFKVDATGKLVTTDGYPVLSIGAAAQAAPGSAVPGAAPGTLPAAQAAPGAPLARTPASTNPFMISPEVLNAKPDPNNPNAPQSPLQEIQLGDVLNQGQKIMITPDGEIYAGTNQIAKIAVAEFADPRLLQKTTSTMYLNSNPANVPKAAEQSRTRQGFLEMSNVNAVAELTNLLKANRMFESNMRAIRAYGDMSAKEANEVGKL